MESPRWRSGLGRAVVDGGKCLSFCPRYPRHMVQFSSVEDILTNTQSDFWALELDLRQEADDGSDCRDARSHASVSMQRRVTGPCIRSDRLTPPTITRFMTAAQPRRDARGEFRASPETRRFSAGSAAGTTDAQIGEDAFGRPVEIEFAVQLPIKMGGDAAEFGFLQIRPLVLSREGEELRI